MLRNASTRVLDRSMMRCLKSSKLLQPEDPASTIMVTPALSVKRSACNLLSPPSHHPPPVTPPIIVICRTPRRCEVLAHIDRARHCVACDGARKTEAQCITVPLGVRTGNLHGVSLDGSRQIP